MIGGPRGRFGVAILAMAAVSCFAKSHCCFVDRFTFASSVTEAFRSDSGATVERNTRTVPGPLASGSVNSSSKPVTRSATLTRATRFGGVGGESPLIAGHFPCLPRAITGPGAVRAATPPPRSAASSATSEAQSD